MIKSASIISTLTFTLGLWMSFAATAQLVPATLRPPAGNDLFLVLHAKGVQIYRCVQDQKDTSRFSWIFVAPAADLYTDLGYTHYEGKHLAGPAWEDTDGSKVTGKKLQQADSPDTAAIPWLLLGTASVARTGVFSETTFIQRIATHGGKLPVVVADRQHLGQEIKVPYMADYLFYRAVHQTH